MIKTLDEFRSLGMTHSLFLSGADGGNGNSSAGGGVTVQVGGPLMSTGGIAMLSII